MSLAVIVLTFNEADYIGDCLSSLRPLNAPVIVVDSGSKDATIRIAQQYGAIVRARDFDGFANQRNAALEMTDAEWILFLDADERLTRPLCSEILRAIESPSAQTAGFWLARKNLAFGHILRGGGWWPDHQARLLRRGRASYSTDVQVHETVQFDGDTFTLRNHFLHLNYRTHREYIRKQRQYSSAALAATPPGRPAPGRRSYLGRPLRELWQRLISEQGVKDGFTGIFMAAVLAFEELRICYVMRSERSN